MMQYFWYTSDFTDGERGWICHLVSRRRKIGTAHVIYNRRNKHGLILAALKIRPQYQRLGYGRQLLQQVIDEFSPEWYELRLKVQPFANAAKSTEQLIDYYRQFGFMQLPSRANDPIMRRLLFRE